MTRPTLYFSRTGNSLRAAIAVELAPIEVDRQFLDMARREHKAPDFLAINPAGAVPVFVDVRDSGDDATGYLAGDFHGVGDSWPLFDELRAQVIGKPGSQTPEDMLGETLYNRGLMNAVIVGEAIRTAHAKFGNRVITGEEMRWGLENLDLTEERLAEIGLAGFTNPISVTCEDHEGNHPVYLKRWNGSGWDRHSEWIEPMREVVRPLIEAEAAHLAKERGLPTNNCAS